ncbi:hypothetical protein M3Y96_00326900 [Aphelenchoides besseyi]|nr:hypothetical protein M3Y96_00326900 [Aphelenchoides besseyi]
MTIGDSVGEMFKDESLDKSGVQIDQSSADDPLVSGEEYRQIEGELNDQILNLTTESYVVGERSTVEGEETNEATTDDMEVFLQEFVYSAFTSVFSLNGRYQVHWTSRKIHITDMLYSRETCLNFDFSSATIAGEPLQAELKAYEFFAFDFKSTTVLFHDNSSPPRYYIGIGKMDLKRLKVSVEQSIALPMLFTYCAYWFPVSFPPNLNDGLILKFDIFGEFNYFHVKVDSQNQLQATKLDCPSEKFVGTIDSKWIYGFKSIWTDDEDLSVGSIELVKYSIVSGETTRIPTANWEILDNKDYICGCSIGRTFFTNVYNSSTHKSRIFSMDLDTLKWKETGIELDGSVEGLSSDGERSLIVRVAINYLCSKSNVYRFVFYEPDSLSTSIWLHWKGLFASRPSAYKFVLSKLPSTARPKLTF